MGSVQRDYSHHFWNCLSVYYEHGLFCMLALGFLQPCGLCCWFCDQTFCHTKWPPLFELPVKQLECTFELARGIHVSLAITTSNSFPLRFQLLRQFHSPLSHLLTCKHIHQSALGHSGVSGKANILIKWQHQWTFFSSPQC